MYALHVTITYLSEIHVADELFLLVRITLIHLPPPPYRLEAGYPRYAAYATVKMEGEDEKNKGGV